MMISLRAGGLGAVEGRTSKRSSPKWMRSHVRVTLSRCAVFSTKTGALLLVLGEGGGLSPKYVFNLISAQLFPFRPF